MSFNEDTWYISSHSVLFSVSPRHFDLFGVQQSQQPNDVQMIPPTMGTALGPVNYGARTPVPKDRGTVGRPWHAMAVWTHIMEAVCTKMYYT